MTLFVVPVVGYFSSKFENVYNQVCAVRNGL